MFDWLFGSGKSSSVVQDAPTTETKRIRMTDNQIACMSCASFDKPIYGENPSHMYSQMPNGASCFPLRTIESLEKRGYLVSDGKGGFICTSEGMDALRSAMGF